MNPNPIYWITTLVFFLQIVLANIDSINNVDTQVCAGMYDKRTWGGSVNPFISTNLKSFGDNNNDNENDIDVSIIVFDYADVDLIGYEWKNGEKKYVCDTFALELNICDKDQFGQFIYNQSLIGQNTSEIKTFTINNLGLDNDELYPISNTGYYCVASYNRLSTDYKIDVNFRNSFGKLSAAEFPKLTLYAALAIAYAVSLANFGFQFYRHKHEILPLQKYFLAFFIFLTVENVLIWSYYDLTNRVGSQDVGVKVYMVFISLLGSAKFTFSFFLLLVIALGYGVVYPKLEKQVMLKCKILAFIHYSFAVFYTITTYLSNPENPNFISGIAALLIIIATAVFYFTSLKALKEILFLLNTQKQIVKLKMYQYLFRTIVISLLALVSGVFISSFVFIGMTSTELIEQHWKSRFFFFDFWPSLVYFIVFNIIAYIWRPTDTSYMLVASQQLPTDPEYAADFELDDIGSLQGDNDRFEGQGRRLSDDSLDLERVDENGNENGNFDQNNFDIDEEIDNSHKKELNTNKTDDDVDSSPFEEINTEDDRNYDPFKDPENPFTKKD
ncbi:hypothetical protein WICMUC_002370 [Wickerhamomyces mucosus]|uniref:Membrane protein PTM1 n=1 Tax=Wickerhamomyces mucosus TaxID=1378264 RepID=A0A9P8PPU2_9ASCO|nr:hypothetical protein WICMUC_002370 [Wickerhamomyces mucosus]